MTLEEIITMSRNKYNAVGNNFFSDAELRDLVYQAEMQLVSDGFIIDAVDSSITTVDGTRTYDISGLNWISLKKVYWDGRPLIPIDFDLDDDLTFDNEDTTAKGTPNYYYVWEDTIYLRPIPNAAKVLKIYYSKEPTQLTEASSAVSVPTEVHTTLTDFVAAHMAAKDMQADVAAFYFQRWGEGLARSLKWSRKRRRGDKFAIVKDEGFIEPKTLRNEIVRL